MISLSCTFASDSVEISKNVRIEDKGDSWVVSYPVSNGTAEYTLNKSPKKSAAHGELFQQFVSMVKYNNIPLTHIPYPAGVSGLVLVTDETKWTSEIETNTPIELIIKYTNRYYNVRLSFIDDIPLMKISVEYSAPYDLNGRFNVNWNFWQAIGGNYNPGNRVIIPQGEYYYFVINGQAEGIHYFPSAECWSLRMGEENTPYQNITLGFVYRDDSIVQHLTEFNKKPDTWANWSMGQDLYIDTNNQFQKSFDVVPYDLDTVTDKIYNIYQEDEAGLFYSWMDTCGKSKLLRRGEKYHYEVYFWVGEDNWQGLYGKNKDSGYRFMIDRYQDILD